MIKVIDQSEPLFRVFKWEHLKDAIRSRELVLAAPAQWDDPYELLPDRIQVIDKRGAQWDSILLQQHLRPVYAQSWSRNGLSDTLLRAYSRVQKDPQTRRNTCCSEEGVRVRTTAGKLLSALRDWSTTSPERTCFLNVVHYLPQEKLKQEIANRIDLLGCDQLSTGRPRADLLLLKRKEYAHESEVRLIYVEERDRPIGDFLHIPFSPDEVFEQIAFDPRLITAERNERAASLRNLGFEGAFASSDFYRTAFLEVILNSGQA